MGKNCKKLVAEAGRKPAGSGSVRAPKDGNPKKTTLSPKLATGGKTSLTLGRGRKR